MRGSFEERGRIHDVLPSHFASGLALGLCACGAASPASPTARNEVHENVASGLAVQSDAGPTRRVLTLVRTACYGRCPYYRVSVDEDGKVAFDGVLFVAKTGRSEWSVEPQVAAGLMAHMRAMCADGSCLESGGCGALDVPQAGVRLTMPAGRQTFISCSDRDATNPTSERIALENEIDRVLGTAPYVECDPDAARHGPSAITCAANLSKKPW